MQLDSDRQEVVRRQAMTAIRRRLLVSSTDISVIIKDRRAILVGDVTWRFQRRRAESAVRRLGELDGVENRIRLRSRAEPSDIRRKVTEAIRGKAEADAERTSEMALKCRVRSWVERSEAGGEY